MWHAQNAIDRYALCHLTSAAGDSLLAISLADSVFFSLPVGQAQWRVVAYLGLTMLPLAVAAPLLVVPLDRVGPRRLISFLAAVVRATIAFSVAGQLDTVALYPAALAILVAARVHGITKNGLTMAYAGPGEGLMRSNARLGRVAVAGALTAAPFGAGAVVLWGSGGAMVLAGIVYSTCALVTLRLPHPRVRTAPKPIGRRGRIPILTGPAIGAAGMRAATGFLLFLSAFAIRREGFPPSWFAAMAIAAAAGGFLADVLAPRLPETLREEFIVVGCTVAAGLGRVPRVHGVLAPGPCDLRADRGGGHGARPPRVPEPDAGPRAGGGARTRLRALRGDVPALLGRGGPRARRALDRLQGRDADHGRLLPGARRPRGRCGSTAVAGSRSEHRRTCRRLARVAATGGEREVSTWRSS